MDASTSLVRLQNWKTLIDSCNARPVGQTKREWLAENGIHEKQFYYWQRRIRRIAFGQLPVESRQFPDAITQSQKNEITFAELRPATRGPGMASVPCPDAVIQTAGCTIGFSNSASPALVKEVMEVVLHA